jgi:16S rRNA (guanine527-N7)-methyltransferase
VSAEVPLGPYDFGPEQFAIATGVSHETLEQLKVFVQMLAEANVWHNLISKRKREMADVWRRHVWDSAQLAPLVSRQARSLADLGSGAGFPGLVLAIMLQGRVRVTLIDSTAKKCQFLRSVADRLGLAVEVRNVRAEVEARQHFDVVTSRACAPLPKLLGYAHNFTGPNSVCLFLKGQNLGAELTDAHKSWKMQIRQFPSQTSPSGVILEVRELSPHAKPQH